MEGNVLCKQIDWDDNAEFYRAWEEARTGYPWSAPPPEFKMIRVTVRGKPHLMGQCDMAEFSTFEDFES